MMFHVLVVVVVVVVASWSVVETCVYVLYTSRHVAAVLIETAAVGLLWPDSGSLAFRWCLRGGGVDTRGSGTRVQTVRSRGAECRVLAVVAGHV